MLRELRAHLLAESGIGDIMESTLAASSTLHARGFIRVSNGLSIMAIRTIVRAAREAIEGADVLIGLSGPGIIEREWVSSMADDARRVCVSEPGA